VVRGDRYARRARGGEGGAMKDTVLLARIAALEQSLEAMSEPEMWERKLELRKVLRAEIWRAVKGEIRKKTLVQSEKLESIRDALEEIGDAADDDTAALAVLRNAWDDYATVGGECQAIFGECLEILGGLAFRDKVLDDRLCQVADELINHCASEARVEPSLTVPAREEARNKTFARIVRMRFPEWTIWNLPLTAHEYGHVLVDEKLMGMLVQPVTKRLVLAKAGPLRRRFADREGDDNEGEPSETRALYHIRLLTADAFATYTMGPAYAAATILLRLDPSAGGIGSDYPADALRAYVVLRMLDKLDRAVRTDTPYKEVKEKLSAEWDVLDQRLGRPVVMTNPETDALTDFVDEAWQVFNRQFLPGTRYPYRATPDDALDEEGWIVAQRYRDAWERVIEQGEGPDALAEDRDAPAVTMHSKMRDVLNAAWFLRVFAPEHSASIAKLAQDTCTRIVDERQREELEAEKRRKRRQSRTRLQRVAGR
jgi:hypothetical protein